jgi:hypothetical protein
MPLHEYIKEIYEGVEDSAYVVRFIDYLIKIHYKNPVYTIKNDSAVALVMGVLENVKTKERYASFEEFYSKATGNSVHERNLTIFRYIYVTAAYNMWRVICRTLELNILKFYDFHYRSYLLYQSVIQKLKHLSPSLQGKIKLSWNDNLLYLTPDRLSNKASCKIVHKFLEDFEDSVLHGVYYCDNDIRYLIIP